MHLVDSKTNVILSIEDGGDGILPENIGHIFNPFFTTKPIGEGAGLGLSQALSIIKTDFNGHIDVTSTPDVGSEFTIVLPVSEHE